MNKLQFVVTYHLDDHLGQDEINALWYRLMEKPFDGIEFDAIQMVEADLLPEIEK